MLIEYQAEHIVGMNHLQNVGELQLVVLLGYTTFLLKGARR